MMKRKRYRAFALLVLLFAVGSFARELDLSAKRAEKQYANVQLLFVQTAQFASINPQPQDKAHSYILRLYPAPKNVIYFSNAPKRLAGKVSLSNFLDVWQSHKSSPNVELEATDLATQKPISIVMKFSDPVYRADTGTLTYKMQSWRSDGVLPRGVIHFPLKLSNVSLFIDHFSQWPP